jgi:hypothetical protein
MLERVELWRLSPGRQDGLSELVVMRGTVPAKWRTHRSRSFDASHLQSHRIRDRILEVSSEAPD